MADRLIAEIEDGLLDEYLEDKDPLLTKYFDIVKTESSSKHYDYSYSIYLDEDDITDEDMMLMELKGINQIDLYRNTFTSRFRSRVLNREYIAKDST